MKTRTSPRGNKKKYGGGFVLLNMAVTLIIAAVSFASMIGAVAAFAHNSREIQNEVFETISERNKHVETRPLYFPIGE